MIVYQYFILYIKNNNFLSARDESKWYIQLYKVYSFELQAAIYALVGNYRKYYHWFLYWFIRFEQPHWTIIIVSFIIIKPRYFCCCYCWN